MNRAYSRILIERVKMMTGFRQWLSKESTLFRDILVYTVVASILAGGAYYVYGRWTRDSRPQQTPLACSHPECDYTDMRALRVGEVFPFVCPRCDQKSVLPGFNCPDCGTINLWNESIGREPPTRCIRCERKCYHGMP